MFVACAKKHRFPGKAGGRPKKKAQPTSVHAKRAAKQEKKSVQQKTRHAGQIDKGQIMGAAVCVGRALAGASPGTDVEGQVYDERSECAEMGGCPSSVRAVFLVPCAR